MDEVATRPQAAPEASNETVPEFPMEQWKQLAADIGYRPRYEGDYPASVLDMYVGTGEPPAHEPLIKLVYRLGFFKESFSSNAVDNFRAVMETAKRHEQEQTPLRQLAESYGEMDVVDHWTELRTLYGLHDDTSLDTLKRDQANQQADRQYEGEERWTHRDPESNEVRQADRINSGTLPFESQARGGYHPWGGPGGWAA